MAVILERARGCTRARWVCAGWAVLVALLVNGADPAWSRVPRRSEQRADQGAAGQQRTGAQPPAAADAEAGGPPHRGPEVAPGTSGTARFVSPLYQAYRPERAMRLLHFADRFYREPANDGYEATIDRLLADLRAAGYGREPGLELEVIETPQDRESWTPISASITVLHPARPTGPGAGGKRGDARGADDGSKSPPPEVILSFDESDDRHRCMLPTGAPSADVTGRLVVAPATAGAGEILVTGEALGRAARSSPGAAAILSWRLAGYNVDPTGEERHLHAIRYGSTRSSATPVAHLSRVAYDRLVEVARSDSAVRVRFTASVRRTRRPLRTVVATVVGAELPLEVVALASHVQEPGAVDNASGVAGMCEAMTTLAELVAARRIPRPRRSVAMIWGDEMRESRIFLDHLETGRVVAAFSGDMLGASRARTGALPLLERDPDPGALRPLPPDRHTPWGAGRPRAIRPSAVADVARCALRDVAAVCGGWQTAEHPWEGGSDHDVFLRRGTPAVLFWHFTDFAYHTSLDRIPHVDPEELRRTCVALASAALGIADLRSEDLPRYHATLDLAESLRVRAAEDAGDPETAERWRSWYRDARAWLDGLAPRRTPRTPAKSGKAPVKGAQ